MARDPWTTAGKAIGYGLVLIPAAIVALIAVTIIVLGAR